MSGYMSSMMTPGSFDPKQLTFDGLKSVGTSGAKIVYMKYGSGLVETQTPVMRAPFGVDTKPLAEGGEKITLVGSFEEREKRKSMNDFFEMLQKMDERVLQVAFENSQQWFKKKYPDIEVLRVLYSPIVKFSKDKETGEVNLRYPPTMRMTLPKKDGSWAFDVIDSQRADITAQLSELVDSGSTRGANFQAVIRATGIWISGNGFGVTWKVRKLRLNATPKPVSEYVFETAPEDEALMEVDTAKAASEAEAGAAAGGSGFHKAAGASGGGGGVRKAAAAHARGVDAVEIADSDPEADEYNF